MGLRKQKKLEKFIRKHPNEIFSIVELHKRTKYLWRSFQQYLDTLFEIKYQNNDIKISLYEISYIV